MWLGAESNRRHVDFQSTALPTELPSREDAHLSRKRLTLNLTSDFSAESAELAEENNSSVLKRFLGVLCDLSGEFRIFAAISPPAAIISNNALAKFRPRRIVANAVSSIACRGARI